jgi:hypothetical protein
VSASVDWEVDMHCRLEEAKRPGFVTPDLSNGRLRATLHPANVVIKSFLNNAIGSHADLDSYIDIARP